MVPARESLFRNGFRPSKGDADMREVIVTGGDTGIGYAIADAFVAAGDRVVITGRRTDRLDAAVDRLARRPGRSHSTRANRWRSRLPCRSCPHGSTC
jgi:NAD(P)-dependent dehydrogenase (short-subunit alcohol dehydrogenase family)